MNNIEYESLKKKVDKEIKDGGYPYDDLSLLLQYRREHNIFEVGDEVVFVSEKMDFLDDDKVHSILMITENNLPKVCGLYVSFESIKHATDAEIKLGRRID